MTPDSTFDLLAVGVTLTMTLRSDGTTTGTLLVPDVTEDLAGTWDATPSVVHFRQPEPQFFNQMPFVIGPGELRGELVVQPGTIRVTLTKRAGAPGGRGRSHHARPPPNYRMRLTRLGHRFS